MTTSQSSQQLEEAFGERMVALTNHAALSLMMSLGHQTGLFDVLADLPPSTVEEIAAAARLHARYAQEWLGAMVTGRIVDYDAQTRRYFLPPEHAAWLTRAAGDKNMARLAQSIAMLSEVEQKIVESFRNGGGVPYAEYSRFQHWMAEGSADTAHATLFDMTLPLAPDLVPRLRDGIVVADIGCGQGHTLNVMAQAFPQSTFVGYDISCDAIAEGRREAVAMRLENVSFDVLDAVDFSASAQFDFITAFDAIHDQVHPAVVLGNILRALKPGGLFLMVDIAASSSLEDNLDLPFAPWLYTISCMHCMAVSLAHDGAGLGAMWGEQTALAMLADAGFVQVEVRKNEGDPVNNYYLARRPT